MPFTSRSKLTLIVSEECEIGAGHDGDGNVELQAREPVKLLHLDHGGSATNRRKRNETREGMLNTIKEEAKSGKSRSGKPETAYGRFDGPRTREADTSAMTRIAAVQLRRDAICEDMNK